jgi:hypothetical protein
VPFVTGDASCNGHLEPADLAAMLAMLFTPPPPPCPAVDANDDGTIGAGDVAALVRWLASGPRG